jgi:dTDP-4-dehydrorhamnose 3,5-epimerase
MEIISTPLPGVLLLRPRIFRDDRGMFWETWNEQVMAEAGLTGAWRQDNTSISHKNVVRGIHYQVQQPQGKLVRAIFGRVLDVAVDLRRSSSHFGKHFAVELSGDDSTMIWIPAGFGHAFTALSDEARVLYKVTDYYSPAGERTILWNDPDLGIKWPVSVADAIISSKDAAGRRLAEAEVFA